ncbi:6-phosphogluconolactonase [Burkholderia sp. b14]|nr:MULTISPECIES: 6-phosphogluconolactonase [unclassified Mycetohabitans]SIT72045.1 6-phosphogluconolactonase [Burkholderia sp. b14]SIT73011.1 6-phosphogluconolactonase [Burkholderia sp. b13]
MSVGGRREYGGEVIELHAFDDARAQQDALSQAVGDALQSSLAARIGAARATLAVSGGTSPRPFLHALSRRALDWTRIDVTLVDDRWVPPMHADSNARLVRDTLLQHAAREAVFQPLVDVDQAPAAHVAALNADASRALPDVAVLGMGEDGHTASIFADAPQWDLATRTHERYVLVQPRQAPHLRVSLSLSALRQIGRLFLLVSGQRKLDVLRAAIEHPQHNAISKLANDTGVNVDAYWCA